MVFWIMFGLILPTMSFGGEYSERTERDEVLANVVEQGVDRTWAAALLDQAERKQSILDAISRPAEKTKPWYDYRKIFLTDKRAREGVAFAQQNAETLAKVSDQITGSYRVIDALATLAFDYPKRSPFFTRELQNFLVLAYESGKDPLALKGSYAGAMGYGQFMPSSYRAYAVDYDGDGVADIWTNADDAIASVANYFLRHGWQPGAPVIVPANYDGDSSEIFAGGLKPEKTVGELAEEGFAPRSATDISLVATPLRLEGSEGYEYWLCLENFYVITRYNHSAMYALSVWQLSQEIESLAAGA
jgi:membrane-bound lytic murein transglycosylase B